MNTLTPTGQDFPLIATIHLFFYQIIIWLHNKSYMWNSQLNQTQRVHANGKHKQKEILKHKCNIIYRSVILVEILKPWGTIVIGHPLDIVPKQGNSINQHTVATRSSLRNRKMQPYIKRLMWSSYLWFEIYMMGTPGIFLTLLFKSLSTVARM